MSDLTDAGTADDARKIHQVIQKRQLPESIRKFHVEFGTDSTGDPAVTIWLVVDDDPNPPKQVLDQVTEYVREIRDDLMDSRLHHWPYIRFSSASEAERYFR